MKALTYLLGITLAVTMSSSVMAKKDIAGKRDEKTGLVVHYENYVLRPGYLIEGKAQNQSKKSYTSVDLNFNVFDKDGDKLGSFQVRLGAVPAGARQNFRLQWLTQDKIDGYAPSAVVFAGAEVAGGEGGVEKLEDTDPKDTKPAEGSEARGDETATGITIEKRGATFLATDVKNGVTVEYEWRRQQEGRGSSYRTYLVTGKVRRNDQGPSTVSITVHIAALARDGDKLASVPVFTGPLEHGGLSRFEQTIQWEYNGDKLRSIEPFKIETRVR